MEVFSSETGVKYVWFLIPLFAPYVGALIGTYFYFICIAAHLIDEQNEKRPNFVIPIIKTASLARFDEDDELEADSIQEYTDKICT